MSRSNPYKKKKRSAKKTLLIYAEGRDDYIFLKHLKNLYESRNSDLSCKIVQGTGGGPISTVSRACKVQGDYQKRVVVFDNDRSVLEMNAARLMAKRRTVRLIEFSPCLEAFFLTILREGKRFSHKTSSWCKKEFEVEYVNSKRRGQLSKYEKVFPKRLLNGRRKVVKKLDVLIELFEKV